MNESAGICSLNHHKNSGEELHKHDLSHVSLSYIYLTFIVLSLFHAAWFYTFSIDMGI